MGWGGLHGSKEMHRNASANDATSMLDMVKGQDHRGNVGEDREISADHFFCKDRECLPQRPSASDMNTILSTIGCTYEQLGFRRIP